MCESSEKKNYPHTRTSARSEAGSWCAFVIYLIVAFWFSSSGEKKIYRFNVSILGCEWLWEFYVIKLSYAFDHVHSAIENIVGIFSFVSVCVCIMANV